MNQTPRIGSPSSSMTYWPAASSKMGRLMPSVKKT
jgi:hypothetical protein